MYANVRERTVWQKKLEIEIQTEQVRNSKILNFEKILFSRMFPTVEHVMVWFTGLVGLKCSKMLGLRAFLTELNQLMSWMLK